MQGDDRVDESSSLKGQIAGLKLQLSSAHGQVQQLGEQVKSETASRETAEQERQHLWESQLLYQQQSVTKQLDHEKLLQQVASHDKQQQLCMSKLQRCEEQNAGLVAQLQSRCESHQQLAQQCQQLQGQVTSSSESCQQLSEKLCISNSEVVQLQKQLDCLKHQQMPCPVQQEEQQQRQEEQQLQKRALEAQLQHTQQSMAQLQAQLQLAETQRRVAQHQLDTQQKLHEQQQQSMQQQMTAASEQQRSSSNAEMQSCCDQLRHKLAVLTRQNEESEGSIVSLRQSVAQAERKAAEASGRVAEALARVTEVSARAAESCARVDALILSEASLRVQLGAAEEHCNHLCSQHDQVSVVNRHLRLSLNLSWKLQSVESLLFILSTIV